jgi:phosphate transport system substrate-binding protein
VKLPSPRLALAIALLASGAAALASSCTRSGDGPKVIDGAGATLPFPLYARWASEFARVDASVRVNYQPLGSGAGMRQMSDGVIDFGATDEPMSDEQLKRSPVALVHVPMTIGAVVVTYNVPGVAELKLEPDVVADVFRGVVARWDDPRVRATNPNVSLPSEHITVVHRADGSGTSATFTTFLSLHSGAWRADVGAGIAPRFPVGVGARGNDGVTAYVKATPYAIGYVELAYARQAGLPALLVKNRSGNYIAPTLESLDRAARSALPRMPDDLRLSIVDSEDESAYPIAALSFIVLPRDAKERPKAEALARFVWWGLHEGQRHAAALDYAPLPSEIVIRAERAVKGLRAEGKPISVADGVTGS